jgi:hypothetical protein
MPIAWSRGEEIALIARNIEIKTCRYTYLGLAEHSFKTSRDPVPLAVHCVQVRRVELLIICAKLANF